MVPFSGGVPGTPLILEVVQALSRCRDAEAVLAVLTERVRPLLGADGVTVVLRDGDLCHYVDEDAIAPLWKGRRFPMSACISGWCMLNGRQVAIPDIYADPRIPADAYRPTFVHSLAMSPIRREEPIGAIGAYWAEEHHASDEELAILEAIGDAASVAFANAQLIAALTASNRRKDELLAMLAHELRNPLAPIANYLYVLRQRGQEAEVRDRACSGMERQVWHLARLVDDLVDAARLEGGKLRLAAAPCDLGSLVSEAVADAQAGFEAARVQLVAELPEDGAAVVGDAARLRQVLGNLLDNARKFTPAGGRVTVRLGRQGEQMVVEVIDTGEGIDAELLPRVFELFTQGASPLDRPQRGLGLGLALAREIVELHGGSVGAQSDGPGTGTRLTVRLPAGEPGRGPEVPLSGRGLGDPTAALRVDELLADFGRE